MWFTQLVIETLIYKQYNSYFVFFEKNTNKNNVKNHFIVGGLNCYYVCIFM